MEIGQRMDGSSSVKSMKAGGSAHGHGRRLLGVQRACRAGRRRGGSHQRVVARVELDLVDAVADAAVALELRREHVGQPRVLLHSALPTCWPSACSGAVSGPAH
jgi:hypothetical protein